MQRFLKFSSSNVVWAITLFSLIKFNKLFQIQLPNFYWEILLSPQQRRIWSAVSGSYHRWFLGSFAYIHLTFDSSFSSTGMSGAMSSTCKVTTRLTFTTLTFWGGGMVILCGYSFVMGAYIKIQEDKVIISKIYLLSFHMHVLRNPIS